MRRTLRPTSSSPAWRRLDEVPEGDAARVGRTQPPGECSRTSGAPAAPGSAAERLAAEEAARPAEQQSPEEALGTRSASSAVAVDREVLLLAEWEGLSPAQIAAVLGCRRVTARGAPPPSATQVPSGLRRRAGSQRRPRASRFRKGGSMSTSQSLRGPASGQSAVAPGASTSPLQRGAKRRSPIAEAAPGQTVRPDAPPVRLAAVGAATRGRGLRGRIDGRVARRRARGRGRGRLLEGRDRHGRRSGALRHSRRPDHTRRRTLGGGARSAGTRATSPSRATRPMGAAAGPRTAACRWELYGFVEGHWVTSATRPTSIQAAARPGRVRGGCS